MAGEADLEHVYSAGYYLVNRTNPEWWRGPKPLLPDKLISLSCCINPRLDIAWGWMPRNASKEIEKREFGILSELSADFDRWSETNGQVSQTWPLFQTVASACAFISRFRLKTDDYALIGVGRPRAHERPGFDLFGMWDERFDAIWNDNPIPLESGGDILGYEITSFSYGDFGHSWLCSGIQNDMNALFGIIPNKYGCLDTYDDAMKVCDWIAEDEMRGQRSEPEPYFPWLLVSYPLPQPS